MFKNTYQSGLLSIFYSCGSNPLSIWDMEVHNGHVKRLTDSEVNSVVLEIVSTNVATTYISCPKNNQVLGIRLPFLVMIVKNLKRYFSFEITVLDDKNMRRRFRISNFQSTTKIKPFCTTMPIGLSGGWNQIQFNLADFTRRAYGTQFIETLRVQVHANARLRRIYFSDRLYTEEELPQDYKLYLPLERKKKLKETGKPAPGAEGEGQPPPTASVSKSKVKKEASAIAADAPEPAAPAAETPAEEKPAEEATEAERPAETAGEETPAEAPAEEAAAEAAQESAAEETAAAEPAETPVAEGEVPAEGVTEEAAATGADDAASAPVAEEIPAPEQAPAAEETPAPNEAPEAPPEE